MTTPLSPADLAELRRLAEAARTWDRAYDHGRFQDALVNAAPALLDAAAESGRLREALAELDVYLSIALNDVRGSDWSRMAKEAVVAARALLATPPVPSDPAEAAMISGLREDADRDRALVAEWDATLPPLEPVPSDHGAALDVDRLNEAAADYQIVEAGSGFTYRVANRHCVEAIAAEYARLAPSVPPAATSPESET